ncbi:MAG: WbqC family protein [Bacteroidia bacterium]|jgi:hypothetical protein|nr:WbqC family protein [Bacteroidia bacterium]
MNVLLSSAYWPNLHYMYYVLNAGNIFIEQHEHYGKQSFRNRCVILSANGSLNLSIPVKNLKPKQMISEVEIAYKENWKARHWRAIQSAYNNSPYFEYFEQDIQHFYEKEYDHLLDYNLHQLKLLLKLFRVEKNIQLTQAFDKSIDQGSDLRPYSNPKLSYTQDPLVRDLLNQPYYQTFEAKFAFVPNLSILDLLFNKGLESLDYLNYRR